MTNFLYADRVQETTTTTGTGTLSLGGASSQMTTFSLGIGANNPTSYCILDGNGSAWEVGYGTVGAGGTTLTRDTILSSSNSGAAISLSVNTHTVFCTNPAANTPRRLFSNVTPAGTGADTSEDTLMTYTMPANTLAVNGQAVRIRASGALAANTHTRTARVYFGALSISSIATATSTTTQWISECVVYRTGAATQAFDASIIPFTNGNVLVTASMTGGSFPSTSTATLSSTVVIKVTGQTSIATANDVVCNTLLVEYLP